ncbi:MAG: type IV pilin N-terminal domain-containing protein [Methanobacteriota archaeon]|nr:MAG: type IV pilin N-terminal domain-containing protein [Euryarchaeota archaeon]
MNRRSLIRKGEEGVSPVIATILMVAITVVLAAVLYIMVIGLAPPPGDRPPPGQFNARATSNTTAEAEFAGFSQSPPPINLKIVLSTDTASGTYAFGANADGTVLALESGVSMGTITYRDYANNNLVNTGDELLMTGLDTGTFYTIKMLWKDGSSMDTKTFATPS